MKVLGLILSATVLAGTAVAETPASPSVVATPPSTIIGETESAPALTVIPAPSGAVYLPTAKDKTLYDVYHYAPVRRAGDFVYVSGVIAGPLPGEGHDASAFKKQLRRAFQTIVRNLDASGATTRDVVEVDSYHVIGSKGFDGDWTAALAAMGDVVGDYFKPPYPTWNLIGVAGLLEPNAVIEFKVTAYAPVKQHHG